jgi:uracil-DNA glycosylase
MSLPSNIVLLRDVPSQKTIESKLGIKYSVYDIVKAFPPDGWEDLFKEVDNEIKNISDFIEREIEKGLRILPDKHNILRIFYEMHPSDIKVCIIGMDPYHQLLVNGKPRAQGLSFSVSQEDEIPSSLMNIYKEIFNCYPDTPKERIPKNGDLIEWVHQGVMLLNVCLTVQLNAAGSHSKWDLWHPLLNKMFPYISKFNKHVIFVMWGKDAQKMETMISKNFKNMLMAPHPSGLSAYRGFIGCEHFKTINEMLKKQGKSEIVWV